MLGDDLGLALDPVRFARGVGLEPDPWQADVLRSDAQRLLLLCSRQSGKSTTTALLALHTAIYRPDSLVLLLSPSLRQSGELFRKVADFYRAMADPPPPEAESALRLELGNGSRIVSLPGKEATVRGYSGVALLVIDEAARVIDDLYYSVRPMLAVSGGRLIAMSTPSGKRGWLHSEWTGPEPWARVKVVATDCPRISPGFLEEERRALPKLVFSEEYLCEFVELEGTVFSFEDVEHIFRSTISPLFGGV